MPTRTKRTASRTARGGRNTKTSTRSTKRQTDTELDQYKREQSNRRSKDESFRSRTESGTKRKKSKRPEQKTKGRTKTAEHKFGTGAESKLLAENRSARKRRMKADRQQHNASRQEEHWPSRGSGRRRRTMDYESVQRGREEDYPSRQYEKHMYTPMHDEESYAIRKGTEMYIPGYEDVDRDMPETRKHVDLHRGHDDYPLSLTNENLYGGLPDEDFYESRYREWFEDRARARSGHKNYQGAVPSQTRMHYGTGQRRSDRISDRIRESEDRRMLRKTGRSRRGSQAKSVAARRNQTARGWDF